jgi:hypothetical protein
MKQTLPAAKKASAKEAAREAAKVEAEVVGPRLTQILQHSIKPWKREELGEEEAQIAEIRKRPVRNRFDAEEAKRRLGLKPAKRGRTAAKPKHATA